MIRFVDETASTNADVRALAEEGAPHGTAVAARAQSVGRGRLGRTWASPAGGNVYLSVLLRPDLAPDRVPLLCLAAAVATVDSCGAGTRIKWPNDALAPDGRKVAGILAEAESRHGSLRYVVVGIGVNLATAPLPTAASLRELDGVERSFQPFANTLREALLRETARVGRSPAAVLARWRERALLGMEVTVEGHRGLARDVDDAGALLLEQADGTVRRVLAGDVEMVGQRGSTS